MIQAFISGISQDLSFEDGDSAFYAMIVLPNGQQLRALIDGEAAQLLTEMFVQGKTPAAQVAVSRAATEPSPLENKRQPMVHPALAHVAIEDEQMPEGQYSPLTVNGDGVLEFGGKEPGGAPISSMQFMQQQFQEAAHTVAAALGDSSGLNPIKLKQAADTLRGIVPNPLPQPHWGVPVDTSPHVTVSKDDRGYPVLTGQGLVDPRNLAGGNMEGEDADDVGQV